MAAINYYLALALLKGATSSLARAMATANVHPEEFLTAPAAQLIPKLGNAILPLLSHSLRQEAITHAQEEQKFIEAHAINFLLCTSPHYPTLLAQCPDAPIALFTLGSANLSNPQSLAIVGTRQATPLGIDTTNNIIQEIASTTPSAAIISGLAYGIDAAAHTAALRVNCPTIAVLAHGLHTIYPASHRSLARQIINSQGAIITEYPSLTPPLRPRFLQRNRIIAGMAQATLIIESEIKGGAMSTAAHAIAYQRELMAIPGRITDPKSTGCNHLIRSQKATIITSPADVLTTLHWQSHQTTTPTTPSLFTTLPPPQGTILQLLSQASHPCSLDELCIHTAIPAGPLQALLQEMEFDSLIKRLPGNRYSPLI